MWKSFNEHYDISSEGEVKSIRNNIILKTQLNSKGYKRVTIQNQKYFVHRIVALLFIPNPLELPQVNHINSDKTDNRVENLEWCTNQYNTDHSYINGRQRTSGRAIFSKETVLAVLENKDDLSTKELAKLYNMSVPSVYALRSGKNIKRFSSTP